MHDIRDRCRDSWREIIERDPIVRLWSRDHTLWSPDPTEISNRLGWLDLPEKMAEAVPDLQEFAKQVRDDGIENVVLLGMGGSSLCAEVMRRTHGSAKGFPQMHVLDSTVPEAISHVFEGINLKRTLFLVASKSGSTVEALSLFAYAFERLQSLGIMELGRQFVAITDPGSGLEELARERGFRRTFINPADVGGRYSALSYFGLVPAALMGIDIDKLLTRAGSMAQACRASTTIAVNPGALLGVSMGCLAKQGRDKLTILTPPALDGFGLWAEQLVAESTGKQAKGIVPIADEPVGGVDSYGDDRVFIFLDVETDKEAALRGHVKSLQEAGHVVLTSALKDVYDLGAEFFKWEFAVAVAGACLEINPFDQPNVQESKQITGEVLARHEQGGESLDTAGFGSFEDILATVSSRDYMALMVFAAETSELNDALGLLRARLLEKRKISTTLGYGPRFLHSTGQLHKGGPDNVVCVQFICDFARDMAIPGRQYGFDVLASAQAIGDCDALRKHGRRVVRIHAADGRDLERRIAELAEHI